MASKQIIVLANSIKKQARCVAGREVLQSGGTTSVGSWVRPVSGEDEGQLLARHYRLLNGGSASVLDIIEIHVTGRTGDPGQPENWRLDEMRPWRKVGRFSPKDIVPLLENPNNLWLERRKRTNQASVSFQARQQGQSSITLIRPQGLRIRLWTEFNEYKYSEQRKTHAVFSYAGQEYDLSLTDPVFTSRYRQHPACAEPPIELIPECRDKCALCVSLTPPFHGYHYKVVATVLEL